MAWKLLTAFLALAMGACTTPSLLAQPGTLVIVGGGLEADNEEVFRAFLEARLTEATSIAIVPAASGAPSQSAADFRDALVRHGADPADIRIVELAVKDDPATADIDEAGWSANADNPSEIEKIAQAGAIWLTGGDQSRLTELLIGEGGRDTAMLAAIRARLEAGAVVGGTSAGAAIMSDPMITQGDTLAALLPNAPGEEVRFDRGLGFFQRALVDQHFGERARLGRLAALLVSKDQPHRIGIGIDENTAIQFTVGETHVLVLGSGYVTFLDARSAKIGDGSRFAVRNLALSLASSGDRIALGDGQVEPAPNKQATVGNEYFDAETISGGGMALGGSTLAEVAGEALLDNSAARSVERHSFSGTFGVTYRLVQTDDSRGWWGRSPAGNASYALSGIRFDIEPIDITIMKAEN
ncbi:cyanophycinase [Qipengyuania vesicularis]|uniref:cyanophycinase n=1 Tax=Qipengyuania vesicularis TaxID=2867232 RepID=UPI001C88B819|nr:cyanophycinase [Qipengyuania vesicularis]MBX7526491.1 cyanophycinase [Qipengyuania vesicularis]